MSKRLDEIIDSRSVAAVHSVAHGLDFVAAYASAQSRHLPLFLTIHDHPAYTLDGWPTRALALRCLKRPWRDATHRYVISPEMGEDMIARYGTRPYSVVTDGVSAVAPPRIAAEVDRHIYFMGALHFSYRDNVRALLQGLSLYRERHSANVSLVLRGGGAPLTEREKAGVPVTELPWGSELDVQRDLDAAGMVYVPLPFGPSHEYFVKFSLSTKLVTYLACGLPILFHGPSDSAAGHLLSDAEAAIAMGSLDPREIAQSLEFQPARAERSSAAAGELARSRFCLDEQRERFWRPFRSVARRGNGN